MLRNGSGRHRTARPRMLVLRGLSCVLLLLPAAPGPVLAQSPAPAAQTADAFNTEQLDALLAPIALYPDTLLAQVLMASAYPLQIVQAARWLGDPAHKSLSGDALATALQAQSWDPSVKSLVPFPQVLMMMNDRLEWTEQLGYAAAIQQADVLDSVQRLRRQAQAAGNLASTSQQVVRTAAPVPGSPPTIEIEPASPQMVYVPSYNPAAVYGAWPYPAYPPVVLPPPPGYAVGTALAAGLAFGAGVAITSSLWNVGYPNWRGGHMNVNVNRYNTINVNRAQVNASTWRATASNTIAAGRPVRPPAGPVGRPARPNGLPANAIGRASVQVPAGLVNRLARPAGAAPIAGGAAGTRPAPALRPSGATPPPRVAQRAAVQPAARAPQSPVNRPASPAANRPPAGAFGGMRDGRQAGAYAQRGSQSRAMSGAARPPAGGGGGARGGRRG